jgi:hypothetical protein
MARTQTATQERARSRGTEGSVVLIVIVGTLVAVAALVGSQVFDLVSGLTRALP